MLVEEVYMFCTI